MPKEAGYETETGGHRNATVFNGVKTFLAIFNSQYIDKEMMNQNMLLISNINQK